MRIDGCSQAYRTDDRRQRFAERRAQADRREEEPQRRSRAQHAAHIWFQPAFGAHILGQIAPAVATPAVARRAYTQPESRTPLRPLLTRSA